MKNSFKFGIIMHSLVLSVAGAVAATMDFDGSKTGSLLDKTGIVEPPQTPSPYTYNDAAKRITISSVKYDDVLKVNFKSSVSGELTDFAMKICKGVCSEGSVVYERLITRNVEDGFTITLAPEQTLYAGDYVLEFAHRKYGEKSAAEGRQQYKFKVNGDNAYREMARKVNFDPDDYVWESVSCSKKNDKWYRDEITWKIIKKDKNDYYVCDIVTTYEVGWWQCNESNPQTNPGMCVCAAAQTKYKETLTSNCHWEAQWW